MRSCLLILFLFGIKLNSFAQFDTLGPVSSQVINTVIEIEKGNERGSGFLVSFNSKILLVTNKHVVGSWSPVDPLLYSDSLYINLYSSPGQNSNIIRKGINIANSGKPITSKIKIHPNQKIDIAVIDLSNDIGNLPIQNTKFIDTSYFIKLEIARNFLTYGSQVFTIGYPAGLKSFKTNEPLVKSGFLASSLDGNLIMEQTWNNRKGLPIKVLTDGKIFIVDGLIIPGNSGGPVILSQEITWFQIDGVLKHLQNPKNYFIGIVSNIYSNTGLTTIFSADNILEVISQFQ